MTMMKSRKGTPCCCQQLSLVVPIDLRVSIITATTCRPRVFDGLPVDQPNKTTAQDARLATVRLRCRSCDCCMYLHRNRTVSEFLLPSVKSMRYTLSQHNVARLPSSVRWRRRAEPGFAHPRSYHPRVKVNCGPPAAGSGVSE